MQTASYQPQRCPRCNEPVRRTHRRLIDRLISLFYPVHRYRCENIECGWEGTLRIRQKG